MKIAHIVLATDLSEASEHVLTSVSALAKRTGARVTLLHAIQTLTAPVGDGRMGTPVGPPNYESETKAAETALERLAGVLPPEIKTAREVVIGTDAASSIVSYAQEQGADLVAISTHGRTGLKHLIMGSVATAVLRKSSVPVLCFPGPSATQAPLTNIGHILLTTDLSPDALRPFEPVLELAKSLECKVTVLHVLPVLLAVPHGAPLAPPIPPLDLEHSMKQARASAAKQCAQLEKEVDLHIEVVSSGEPAIAIAEYAEQNSVDLVALSSHGRTGFRRLALGSVAEEVLRRSSVPVLSFHRPES